MLEDDLAWSGVGVVDDVSGVLALFRVHRHNVFENGDARNGGSRTPRIAIFHDAHSTIRSIGEQAALARMQQVHDAFSGEGVLFQNIESAAVEGQARGVAKP